MTQIMVQTWAPGNLRPTWIDLDEFTSVEEFAARLYDMSVQDGMIYTVSMAEVEGAERWIDLTEKSLTDAWELHVLSEEHGEAFGKFLELGMHNSDISEWGDLFTESYQGEWDSEGAWLESYMDDIGEAPNDVLKIDWDESFRYGGFSSDYTYASGYMFRSI